LSTRHRTAWIRALVLAAVTPQAAREGPPFKTDDPQPVDFHHWEFYVASQQSFARVESDATLPHIEVNFGAFPDLQIHVLAPMGYVRSANGNAYGYSETELGVKYRFLEESDGSPQAGVFPLVEVPTGDASRQLGQGSAQVYLPLWLQKSRGKFTTYGGAGFDIGGCINLSENDHILVSPGRNFKRENVVGGYLGFQYTI